MLKGLTKKILKKYDPLLAKNLDGQTQRVGNRMASLVIIDGGVGSGKTHSGVAIADHFNGSPIDLKKQYAIGGTAFEEKLKYCVDGKIKVIIYDEAGDFSRRGAITKFNARLNRIFETYRTFQIIVMLILPCMDILDNQLFTNKIPRMLINCHNKIQGKYTRYRAYSLYRMFWLKKYFKDLTVKPQAYTKTRPNFRGYIRPLDPKRAEEVDEISSEGKRAELGGTQDGLYNKYDLAKKMGKGANYIKDRLNQLGVKPAKVVKKEYFWRDDVMDLFQ